MPEEAVYIYGASRNRALCRPLRGEPIRRGRWDATPAASGRPNRGVQPVSTAPVDFVALDVAPLALHTLPSADGF